MKHIFLIILLSIISIEAYCTEKDIVLTTKTGDLYGTLLLPDNNSSKDIICLFICGSGPTDRNGNNPQMKNNSIKYLAEDLCSAGIPSVRYDKRAIAKSAAAATSEADLRFQTYSEDARSWVDMLAREYRRIVIIGHSEGAMLGILASINCPKVCSLVLLSGVGRSASDVLKAQLADQPQMITDNAYPIIDSLANGHIVKNVPPLLNVLFRASVQPYLISWFAINPVTEIKKIKVPILIIQGDKDIQVTLEDAQLLHNAAPNSVKIIIPDMNHVLKACTTMNKLAQMPLYGNPELKNVPRVSEEILKFIKQEEKPAQR